MSTDLRSAKDRAHQLFNAGRFAKSAELYLKLVDQNPFEVVLRLRHAEAARRAGNSLAAVASYRTAARLLVHAGHHARARATLRIALQLAPGHPEIVRALALLEPERATSIADALTQAADEVDIAIDVGEPEPLVTNVFELPLPSARVIEPDFRRLDAQTLAFRRPDGQGWWVVHAATPVGIEEISVEHDAEIDITEDIDVG